MPRGQRRDPAPIVRENPLLSHSSPWVAFDPTERMGDLRVFVEAGKAPAIYDALTLIIEYNVAIPNWLPPAIQSYVEGTFKDIATRYRSKMLHFYRWRTVRKLLEQGVKWDEVFKAANKELFGTQYAGAASTIQDSYDIAAGELADPELALDYSLR